MHLSESFLDSIKSATGFDQESFVAVHESGKQLTSIRVNPFKIKAGKPPGIAGSLVEKNVPWCSNGYYLSARPSFTFDPLFHAGCYYVQEASSMFLEQALVQTTDLANPIRVLDPSAAPGGKSTHLLSLLSPGSLLASNEVIRGRAGILKENIIKWGSSNVIVTNNDPRDWARLSGLFDVLVVDAPCSGSGLFRREPEAIDEWSLDNVALCSQRQQRIIADAWPCLKQDGILIYSTCSYSREEDENIVDWLVRQLGAQSIRLRVDSFPGIIESGLANDQFGYRFFPDKIEGEGFFISVLQKKDGEAAFNSKSRKAPVLASVAEEKITKTLANFEGHKLVKHESTVYAWPEDLLPAMNVILENMRVVYSGTLVGDLMREKLIPSHALALSRMVDEKLPAIELDEAQSIRYLQRKDLQLAGVTKGWHLVKFLGHSLGWVNVLPGRINNYYPKELRILKERP